MSVVEKDPNNVLDQEPERKVEEPKEYAAVLWLNCPWVCEGKINLLCDVFNKSSDDAIRHILNAMVNGRDAVMIGPQDVIETKVAAANEATGKSGTCADQISLTFSCEPA